jgi:hypothetical protein
MTLQPLRSEFPYILEKFDFFFIREGRGARNSVKHQKREETSVGQKRRGGCW